jgi:predicted aspartyl protease
MHIITTATITIIATTATITITATTVTITIIGTRAITTIIASTVVTIIVIGRGGLSGLALDQISYALGQRPQYTRAVAFPFFSKLT